MRYRASERERGQQVERAGGERVRETGEKEVSTNDDEGKICVTERDERDDAMLGDAAVFCFSGRAVSVLESSQNHLNDLT